MSDTIKVFKNTEDVVISDDPIIGEVYKNVTINDPSIITKYILSISEKMTNLCENYYYKISIDIAMFETLEKEDKFDVEADKKKNILLVYALICKNLETANILTEEEMSEDILFLKNLNDNEFFEGIEQNIIEFSFLFTALNDEIYHA